MDFDCEGAAVDFDGDEGEVLLVVVMRAGESEVGEAEVLDKVRRCDGDAGGAGATSLGMEGAGAMYLTTPPPSSVLLSFVREMEMEVGGEEALSLMRALEMEEVGGECSWISA